MNRKAVLLLTIGWVLYFNVAVSQVQAYVFTASNSFYTAINGTSVALTGNGADPVADEGFANNIPLGFSFIYSGEIYFQVSASTNGFISFATLSSAHFSNNLSNGLAPRPLLAPLWEDIALSNQGGLQYTTTGNPGNRVFTIQWSNVLFDFGASTPSLSFQVKLYEGTNKIEYIYHSLPGNIIDYSGGASIGIAGAGSGSGSFLSLNNTSANPTASSTIATNSLVTKPGEGQVYSFTPPACFAPGYLSVSGITATGATVGWIDNSSSSFEYAVTTNPLPPSAGTATSVTSFFYGGLQAATQYYLHVRKDCQGSFSGWNSHSFTTIGNAIAPPYTMPISASIAPALPAGTTLQDVNGDGNSWRSYPVAGAGWTDQVVAYVYNYNTITAANDWLFTRPLILTAGSTYRLSFKYNNDGESLYTEKLKVAFGTSANAAAMTNILANYAQVSNALPKSVQVDFTPASSGSYYIGFQAYSDANKDVLILDDISVALKPSCDVPRDITVVVDPLGTSAQITWQPAASFEYAVTTSATPPASGTVTTNASATASGLLPGTINYVHIRTRCEAGVSDWASIPFATVGNDEPCSATEVVAGAAPLCGNTTLATSTSDPYSSCSTPNNTLWYKYTATATGTVVLVISTPAAPVKPLRGWATWYRKTNECPAISFSEISSCQQFGNDGNGDIDYIVSPLLTVGQTYYIMIDGASNDVGAFCLSIPACSPAINVKVEDIAGVSAKIKWSGLGAYILEYGPAGFTPGSGSVAGNGGTIISPAVSPQSINGLSLSTQYDVYIRSDCSATGNGFSASSPVARFTTLGPPPANDDCAGAVPLTVFDTECGGATDGTTENATQSGLTPLPQCNIYNTGYDDDVWYKFTPGAGQKFVNINFEYVSGNADLVAQVYKSSNQTCNGTFVAYECSDDEGDNNLPGFYSLPVEEGATYFIRVFTLSRAVFGRFKICITTASLINDNVSGAITLEVDAPCTGATYTNVGATHSPDEPYGSCSAITGYATVWYKFVAPPSGAVRVSTAMGTGNTLTDTRLTLFTAGDLSNYESFQVIACDEDGGSGAYDKMSVVYATGLTEGWTYYIQVDKRDQQTNAGTFCVTVENIVPSMLSSTNNCNSNYQVPVGNRPDYIGWVPLMDEDSKLIALVANTDGGAPDAYSVKQFVKQGALRTDAVSGEYYLNRSYKITNTAIGAAPILVQLFYLESELNALQEKDPAAVSNRLRVTRQTGVDCQPDFVASYGASQELTPVASGLHHGVGWLRFTSTGFSNFYIHSSRTQVAAKAYLQGAFSATLGRHKEVTTAWANVLNSFARNQPYNIAAFNNYGGNEMVAQGFFKSTSADTDIVDWVLVELRSSAGAIVSRRAAFIREDGKVVDIDGFSPVAMSGLNSGEYNIAIRHRNHLGVRTSNLQSVILSSLGEVPNLVQYDFTNGQNRAYQNPLITGNPALKDLGNNRYGLYGGNANGTNGVRAIGPAFFNDYLFLVNSVLNGQWNLAVANCYNSADINLDGTVRATGGVAINDYLALANTSLGGNWISILLEHL